MNSKKTIAIVGASSRRDKFGNKAVRAYQKAGWDVYPVHPGEDEVEGLETYTSVTDVPVELDRVSLYLPPAVTREVLPEIAAKGVGEVWLNPGASDDTVRQRAEELGLAVVEGCSIVDIGLSPSMFP